MPCIVVYAAPEGSMEAQILGNLRVGRARGDSFQKAGGSPEFDGRSGSKDHFVGSTDERWTAALRTTAGTRTTLGLEFVSSLPKSLHFVSL